MDETEHEIALLKDRVKRVEEQSGGNHAILKQWPAEKVRYEMMREQMQLDLKEME